MCAAVAVAAAVVATAVVVVVCGAGVACVGACKGPAVCVGG